MPMLIWAPDAPTKMVHPYADEPAYKELRSELPQLTVSSPVGAQLLQTLGVPLAPSGKLTPEDQAALLHRLEELRDDCEARAQAVANFETLVERQLLQYVVVLHDLFTQACARTFAVTWS